MTQVALPSSLVLICPPLNSCLTFLPQGLNKSHWSQHQTGGSLKRRPEALLREDVASPPHLRFRSWPWKLPLIVEAKLSQLRLPFSPSWDSGAWLVWAAWQPFGLMEWWMLSRVLWWVGSRLCSALYEIYASAIQKGMIVKDATFHVQAAWYVVAKNQNLETSATLLELHVMWVWGSNLLGLSLWHRHWRQTSSMASY